MKSALLFISLTGVLAMTAPTAGFAQFSSAALAAVQEIETGVPGPASGNHGSAPAADGYFLSSISETFGNAAGTVFVRRSHGIVFPAIAATNPSFDLNLAYLTGSISEIERTLVANSAAIADFFKAGRAWEPGAMTFLPEASRAGRLSVVVWSLDNGLGATPTTGWYGSLPGPHAPFLTTDIGVGGEILALDLSLARLELQNAPPAPIPEPSTYALILGLAVLAGAACRRLPVQSLRPIAGVRALDA